MLARRRHLCREVARHAARPHRHRLQLEPVRPRLDVHVLLRAARRLGRHLGRLARARRAAQGGVRLRAVLVRRAADRRLRRLHPPAMADVARRRRHRRHRSRPRLHLARLHAHQMVSRPPRHGDRHGHHGLRRRRHDRLAAGHDPDERLQGRRLFARRLTRSVGRLPHGDRRRRVGNVRRPRRHLLRVHAGRRLRLPPAAGRMEARRAGRRRPTATA